MLETLVTAAATLVVGVTTTWLTIGGRERRARATIREELDLIDRLGEHTERAQQIRKIVDKRLSWYVRRADRLARLGAHLILGAVDIIGGTIAVWGSRDEIDTTREALIVGALIGVVIAWTHLVSVPFGFWMEDRRRSNLQKRIAAK